MFLLPLMAQNLLDLPTHYCRIESGTTGIQHSHWCHACTTIMSSCAPGNTDLHRHSVWLCRRLHEHIFSLYINEQWIILPALVQGFGVGFVFVPLSVIAFSTLPNTLHTEASSVFSLLRSIGNSAGVSISSTLL